MSSPAARVPRATCGACEIATARTISQIFGPRMLTSSSAKTSCGNARTMSTVRMRMVSQRPPKYAAVTPQAAPAHAEPGGPRPHQQQLPAAVQGAAQHVPAEHVAAEREGEGRVRERPGD